MKRYIRSNKDGSLNKDATWSKTINLRDYFPEECFDEDGNFDVNTIYEENYKEDWIQFNIYEVSNGIGDGKKFYTAILNMAGFPAHPGFLHDPIIDYDDSFVFILQGDEGYNIPDITYGVSMAISGDMATLELAFAQVYEGIGKYPKFNKIYYK